MRTDLGAIPRKVSHPGRLGSRHPVKAGLVLTSTKVTRSRSEVESLLPRPRLRTVLVVVVMVVVMVARTQLTGDGGAGH